MSLNNSYMGPVAGKTKPGNGASVLPYIQYRNHLKAMEQVKSNTDTGISSPQKDALLKTKKIRHEITQILDKKRKQKKLVTENLKLYSRICEIVEHDRKYVFANPPAQATNLNSFSFLDQKGPRTLNTINKKNQVKDIETENQKIKEKIQKAKSNYSLSALEKHKRKVTAHKSILMGQSPSRARFDPLVKKIERSMVSSASKLSISQSRLSEKRKLLRQESQFMGEYSVLGKQSAQNISSEDVRSTDREHAPNTDGQSGEIMAQSRGVSSPNHLINLTSQLNSFERNAALDRFNAGKSRYNAKKKTQSRTKNLSQLLIDNERNLFLPDQIASEPGTTKEAFSAMKLHQENSYLRDSHEQLLLNQVLRSSATSALYHNANPQSQSRPYLPRKNQSMGLKDGQKFSSQRKLDSHTTTNFASGVAQEVSSSQFDIYALNSAKNKPSLVYQFHKTSKGKQLHSMNRLQKQKRDIDDILWKVTAGKVGMENYQNHDISHLQSVTSELVTQNRPGDLEPTAEVQISENEFAE